MPPSLGSILVHCISNHLKISHHRRAGHLTMQEEIFMSSLIFCTSNTSWHVVILSCCKPSKNCVPFLAPVNPNWQVQETWSILTIRAYGNMILRRTIDMVLVCIEDWVTSLRTIFWSRSRYFFVYDFPNIDNITYLIKKTYWELLIWQIWKNCTWLWILERSNQMTYTSLGIRRIEKRTVCLLHILSEALPFFVIWLVYHRC